MESLKKDESSRSVRDLRNVLGHQCRSCFAASGAEPPAGNAPAAAAADDIQKELETAQLHHALEEFSLTEAQEKINKLRRQLLKAKLRQKIARHSMQKSYEKVRKLEKNIPKAAQTHTETCQKTRLKHPWQNN